MHEYGAFRCLLVAGFTLTIIACFVFLELPPLDFSSLVCKDHDKEIAALRDEAYDVQKYWMSEYETLEMEVVKLREVLNKKQTEDEKR